MRPVIPNAANHGTEDYTPNRLQTAYLKSFFAEKKSLEKNHHPQHAPDFFITYLYIFFTYYGLASGRARSDSRDTTL